ncbi:hypothetical protein [Marivirga harenae]|uniref:hypothetical protein n=1 Tax=Marivirga harenae TaxID=2010992 RepID=UPI0026DED029|nr:hypothetical protein [Marivirga harenae]WKV12196.1 hypothetical protein Q3Y49_18525 [Marivirga harenae]
MKYWLSNEQNKEIFINGIQYAVYWRSKLKQLESIDMDLNEIGVKRLLKFEDYVKNLSSEDILFSLLGNPSEIAEHTVYYFLRSYGDLDAEPEEELKELRKSLLLISVNEDGRMN